MCPQAVGLVQKACEENGIICSTISIIDEISRKLKIIRYLSVSFELGYPLGNPDGFDDQKDICQRALDLVTK